MIGVLGMGRIAQILGAVRHPMPTGLGDDEREPEQPVSFAEITAASAFLDFGGIPHGRWSHDTRVSRSGDFLPAHERPVLPPRVLTAPFENNSIGESVDERKNDLCSARSGAYCMQTSRHGASPLSGRRSRRYVFDRR
jgi:hypothetical protein